jgi:hypothetical protein
MQYEFLMDEAPAVTEIVPQVEAVELIGRAVNFPANTGRAGVMLQIWELDEETGHRAYGEPNATFEVAQDGSWGPVEVDSRKRYEFALTSADGAVHHIYLQNYLRDSHLVRLLSGDAMSATRMNTNTSDQHTAIIAIRMREWYAVDDADLDGDQADVLELSATSQSGGDTEATDLLADFIGNGTIGVHVHDAAGSPKDSTLEPLPYFSAQAFQSGVDFFIPAADPPDGTVTLTNTPRGKADAPQVMRIPNWISSANAVTVQFADYAQ